jgi:polyisoprenoid-binding protein YceI
MSTVAAPARTRWTIDATHSHVEFSIRHLMIATVKGRFGELEGTVELDDVDPANTRVEVSIAAASVDTRVAQRDAHLRSPDFFDVERFPTLNFKSRRTTAVAPDRWTTVGDLTIHGVTREVSLDVTEQGRQTDPWGGRRAGFEARATIKRSDFGLTWNQALETGGVVVGDDVKISIDVELVQQA